MGKDKSEKQIIICKNCIYLKEQLDKLKEPKKEKTQEELEKRKQKSEEHKKRKEEENEKKQNFEKELEELRILNRNLQKKMLI